MGSRENGEDGESFAGRGLLRLKIRDGATETPSTANRLLSQSERGIEAAGITRAEVCAIAPPQSRNGCVDEIAGYIAIHVEFKPGDTLWKSQWKPIAKPWRSGEDRLTFPGEAPPCQVYWLICE